MPIDGLPDPAKHRVCMRCTKWFEPDEGSAAVRQSRKPDGSEMYSGKIIASCHCGKVAFELPRKPRVITECNCSYCRHIGPLFAYYKRRTVHFHSRAGNLESYQWGRGALRWFRCKKCGSFTHHEPAGRRGPDARIGVNLRLVQPDVLLGTTVKLRDGAANTWRVLKTYVI
jgi:hypothetical protein